MGLFEGKTTTERNKMIAAGVLGLVALIALYMAFGRGLFGGSSSAATVKSSPTPKPSATPATNRDEARMPTVNEQDFTYQSTPVDYRPGSSYAPDPGRNIFEFFEPPVPTPYVPTPTRTPTPTATPTPAPTPVMYIASVTPGLVYAGVKPFKFEVNGMYFTPDTRIYFNQKEMPTTFVSNQKVTTEIPTSLIASDGPKSVMLQTPDGKIYSNQVMMNIMAPPKPTFQYIGMIGRKRYNNDTAYLTDNANAPPFGARLNDVVKGQFRIIDISPTEVVVEDVNLGFKHHIPLAKAPANPGGQPLRQDPGFNQFDQGRGIPGIPGGGQPMQPIPPNQ